VNSGDDTFGNGDDSAAAMPSYLATTSSIGPITLGSASGTTASATGTHQYGIEAAVLKSLKVGTKNVTGFPLYIDQGTPGEDGGDVLVRAL